MVILKHWDVVLLSILTPYLDSDYVIRLAPWSKTWISMSQKIIAISAQWLTELSTYKFRVYLKHWLHYSIIWLLAWGQKILKSNIFLILSKVRVSLTLENGRSDGKTRFEEISRISWVIWLVKFRVFTHTNGWILFHELSVECPKIHY